jgi:ABC-type transporter Mla subunit MlaD
VATESVATKTAPVVKKAAAAVLDYGAILKRLVEPITAIIDALGKQNAALDAQLASLRNYGIETKETTVAVVEYELANGKLGQALLALALVYPQAAEALRFFILAEAGEKDQKQTLLELEKQYADARRRSIEQLAAGLQEIDKEIEAEHDRAAAIGLTRAELVNLHLAKEQELLDFLRTAEADGAEIKAVELRIAKYRELRGAIANTDQLQRTRDAWSEVLTSIADRGAQFISDFVQHGATAFKNLWADFKKWALEALAKVAAQQIVLSIAGAAGGSPASAAGGLAQAGGGLGSVSNLASLFGGGSGTVAGIGGYLSSLGGALGAFGSTLGAGFSAGIATLSIAAEAGTAAIGGMASAMGAMAAVAIPVVGWIAAIGIALYAAFGNKGGGPKAGGYASSGDGVIVGGDNNRYFTPSNSDLEIKKATDQLLASYNGIVKALGGTAGKGGFALGFDTDPQGTADNRVSSGAFINGQQVYGAHDLSVGRDDKQLQEALALEGKRVVLAALQASDLPDYLGKLLGSVKVDTASSEDIDRILATAQALKLAVTAFGQLGDQFSKLDPDQVQSVIESFGGVDTFTKALQYLQDNFKTTAERTTETAGQLSAAFAQLGYAVPADHKAFLDLLASLDLTTEAGRTAYASITALAPAFIAVNGTADAAAQALQQEADANKKLLDSAQQFYESNFFTDKGGLARQIAADWDKVHGAWNELGQQLLAIGVDHIPTTNAAFRDLVESIDTSTAAGQALHDALILLAPTIFDLNKQVGALGDVADDTAAKLGRAIADLQDAAGRAASLFSSIMQSIDALANDDKVGDFGAQQSLRLKLIAEQQAKYQALLAAEQGKDPYGALAIEYQRILAQLGAAAQVAAKDLALFTTLSAQYGPALAQQLVGLEDWYAEQQGLLAGNVDALAALKAQFDQKWQDILNGVGGAVDATAAQLEKLRQSIRDYLKGLTLSDLSPSSKLTKLDEAKKQYEDILKKAQAGDPAALGEVTKYADQYLKLAREVFASTPAYNAIFDLIYQQLAALAPEHQKPDVTIDPIERMGKALPVGSPLASQADLREIRDALAVLLGQVVSNTAKPPREHIAGGAGGLSLGLQRK